MNQSSESQEEQEGCQIIIDYLIWKENELYKIRGLKMKIGNLFFKYVPQGAKQNILMEQPNQESAQNENQMSLENIQEI